MNHFVVVVECIIEYEEKFLLIKRPQGVHAGGLLAFPGGKIEAQDGAHHADVLVGAVKREVLEEVGLELIDPIQYATSNYFVDSRNEPVVDVVFYTRLSKTKAVVKASEREVPEYYWMTADEISAHDNAPVWVKRYLSAAIELR